MQLIPMNPTTPPPPAGIPSITLYTITAIISGVVAFCSGILFAGVCNCILQYHEQWRVDNREWGVPTMKKFPHQKVALRMMCSYIRMLHMVECMQSFH